MSDNAISSSVKELSENLKVSYTPVWNVPKNYLTGFIAKSMSSTLDPRSPDYSKLKADEDIALLVYTSIELTAMVDKGDKAVLIVPVSLKTLEQSPYRNNYIQYCRTITDDVRNLIVLKIVDITPEMPTHKLQDILREPSNMVRSAIISTDMRQKRYDILAHCRIHAYSASLTDAPASEAKSFDLLDRFCEMTQAINHASMLEDIPNRSLLGAAIGAGMTYVSGTAVQSPQDSLNIIRPFDLAEIYKAE